MTTLTEAGRAWAEQNPDSMVANVAIHGDGWPDAFVETARRTANENGEQQADPMIELPPDGSDWPIHQPIAPEAPIPGRHWYGGCEPDHPRVNPATGICAGCGQSACPECGHGFYPDGGCGCPKEES